MKVKREWSDPNMEELVGEMLDILDARYMSETCIAKAFYAGSDGGSPDIVICLSDGRRFCIEAHEIVSQKGRGAGKEVKWYGKDGSLFATTRGFDASTRLWREGRWSFEVDGQIYSPRDWIGRTAIEMLFGETMRVKAS